MVEYDGPKAYEDAFSEPEERGEAVGPVEPKFFQAGYEYSDGDPYKAPEQILTFRCGWVGVHPATQEPVAFGFMHSTELGWSGTGMGPVHYGAAGGTWKCHGRWPKTRGGVG